MNFLKHFLELFFPKLCICCERKLINEEKFICLDCVLKLPKTNHLEQPDNQLETFFAGRFPFHRIASFAYFIKGGSIQRLVHELKYKNNPDLGVYLGTLCGKEITKSPLLTDIDCIIPIPLHKNRLRKRGYNQSLEIAKGISKQTGIPIMEDNLIRIIDNPSQTKNSRLMRWKNTEGIFDIKNKNILINKHVLLVDDIITTGSTIEVCAKLIINYTDNNVKISIYSIGSAV